LNKEYIENMNTIKTTRLGIRLTAVLRGKLAEEAGPHGSLSSVARMIIERYFSHPHPLTKTRRIK